MKKLGLLLVVALLSVLKLSAESSFDFYEISDTFFSTPKTWKWGAFSNTLQLGKVDDYSDKNAYIVVGDKSLVFKWPDGNETATKIVSGKEMLTVDTFNGDLKMPLYRLSNEWAVRAVEYTWGTKQILGYVYNINIKKYIHIFTFTLK